MKQRKGLTTYRQSEPKKATAGPATDNHQAPTHRLKPEVRPTGVQLKRKAKLPTVIGLTTKHVVCSNTLML